MVYVREGKAERPCAQTGRTQVAESVELHTHRAMDVDEKVGKNCQTGTGIVGTNSKIN